MGFDRDGIQFLIACSTAGVRFDRTAMIGRQFLYLDPKNLRRTFREFGRALSHEQAQTICTEADGYAEPLLRVLGANVIESIDASTYEGSSIRHDMNAPTPRDLSGQFSTVIDGGTLEHVFSFPAAIRTCMEMVAPGGHLLTIAPANDQLGHGFFQFSPELFYRVLSPDNGFQVEQMLIHELWARAGWYEVADPQTLGRRVTMRTKHPAYLYVRARRLDSGALGMSIPQQSDYADAWSDADRERSGRRSVPGSFGSASLFLRRLVPATVRYTLSRMWSAPPRRFRSPEFRRVDLTTSATETDRASSERSRT